MNPCPGPKTLQPYNTHTLRCGTALSCLVSGLVGMGCRDPPGTHGISPTCCLLSSPVDIARQVIPSDTAANGNIPWNGFSQTTLLWQRTWEKWVEGKRQNQCSSKYWHKTITKHYCKTHTDERVSLWMSTAWESASDSCTHVHISSAKEHTCRNITCVSTGCRNWDEANKKKVIYNYAEGQILPDIIKC